MTDNFNEENKEPETKPHWSAGSDKTLKFLAVCLSAFLGGFLAVFALSGIMALSHKKAHNLHRPLPPAAPVRSADDIFWGREIDDDFEIPAPKPPVPVPNKMNRIVNIEETPDSYKVYVNLKKFNNDEKNINVQVKPHSIKISGKANVNNKTEQSSFSYSQEMSLSRKVDIDDVTKERMGSRYVITLPVDED